MRVICVPRRPMDPTYPHDAISGVEVLLSGAARSDGPPLAECEWEFGDATKSKRAPVKDPLVLDVKHVYNGPVGHIFRATLTVWDVTGDSGRDDYYVWIRPDSIRARAHIASDYALWNLHKRMNRYEDDGVPAGYWDNPGHNYRVGITAACIQAFENVGNFPFDDVDESPYVEDVRRGLNQLLLDMRTENIFPQNAGDPDLNGNGIGLLCHHEQDLKHIFSSHGLAMMAIVMSRDPQRLATVGGPHVLGRTFADIVQDMVEFAAFGQTDDNPEGIVARGGWRYDRPNCGEADMACTQWPVSGLMMAERNWSKFGVRVPSWVKGELRDNFLLADHDSETGGWQYTPIPTGRTNVGLTGIGVLCSAWTGVPFDDSLVRSGLSYIAANWDSDDSQGQFGHFTSMFNMHAIAKAMRAYGSTMLGDHDWYREYAEHLLDNQNADGSWSSKGYEKSWPLTTAWAALILLKPQIPPSVVMDEVEGAQKGVVTLTYRLLDENYDECDLAMEFSTDGGKSWVPATQVGGDVLTHIEASPEGLPRSFIWNTEADIWQTNVDNVLFRITPFDGEKGQAGEITIPGVYNDVVPFDRREVDVPPADGRGVAVADFDDDGDPDVFVANFGQEDFLLRNDSGVLTESAELAGMGGVFPSACGVWGDLNNDGAIDLYLVLAGEPNRLYAADGDSLFTDVAPWVGADDPGGGTSAAWGDFDGDNRLDLYVANDAAFGPGSNALYRNLGGSGFVRLDGPPELNCLLATRSAAWCDFDRDGNNDLYIANGGLSSAKRANILLRNLSASFEDISHDAGVSDTRNAASVVWADFNNDALFDIYLVNSGSLDNVLYLNNGDGTFRDETAQAGLAGPPNAVGAAVGDFDNDGDLDIFVSADGKNNLYVNRGDCTFAEVSSLVGMSEVADSRGAAWADVNGDGFLDLYVAKNRAKDVLYLNGGGVRNWLTVRCLTDGDGDATDSDYADDRDAIGAIVEVDLDGDADFSPVPPDQLEVQCVDGGSGYMSQGQLWPHFGLGAATLADIKVTFPDGSVVYNCGVAFNQTIVIRDISPRGDFYADVFTPQVPRTGPVAIGYVIFNSAESDCEVSVEFSSDGGETWKPASVCAGGEGTSELLSSPQGCFHSYVWDSIRNLGHSNHDAVRIRITPFNPDTGETGEPGETSDFCIDNDTPPRAFAETPSGASTGNIPIHYSLTDMQSDDCSIRVEYSIDGGRSRHWAAPGPAGDGTVGLASSREGVAHIFVWDSFASLGHTVQDNVTIRITPSDRERGSPCETGPFLVDNNLAPSVNVETPLSVQKGNVALNYSLSDPESDPCSVGILYSLDRGRTWLSATMAPGGEGTNGLKSASSGEPHTYAWDSLRDFGSGYSSVVRMMVVPRDSDSGTPSQSGDFTVDNLRPAELAFSPPSLSFSAQEDGESPPPQSLQVWNKGSHSLEWSITSDAGWLLAYPATGASSGEKDTVEVSVDITGLPSGTYIAAIALTAVGAVGSPASIPVVLDISAPPPRLAVEESLLFFRAAEGGEDPSPQSLHVLNAGGGDMLWQAETNRGWITISPASGSSAGETDTIEVQAHIGKLSAGSYSGAITISAPGAVSSPQVVSVSLDIQAAPRELNVSPSELRFITRRGGPGPPDQELRLTVSGDSEVAWQAYEDPEWLSLSPSSGTNSGEETVIRVAVEKKGLDIGSYRAEVTFAAVGLPLLSQKVVVALDVVPIMVPDDFPSIQEAINEAQSLDVVKVSPGVYLENISMKDGVEVIGSGAALTTIRPGRPSSVVVFSDILSGALEGFTICDGTGDFFGREGRVGGGIYCANSDATVRNCVISANSASWGGGVCVDKNSTLTLEDCSLYGNTAASGAGVFCYEDCLAILLRTRLLDNSVTQYGAAVCAASTSSILLKSCEVFRNSAELGGGGIFVETGASLEAVSCTIADNRPEGILADPGASVTVSNTILWSNPADLVVPAGQEVHYCDIGTGDFAGSDGNISQEPCFVAADEGCYDLLPNSPCIDAGLNSASGLPAADIHGEPRIVAVGQTPITDIGADEHDPQRIFILLHPEPQPGPAGEVSVPFSLWNARSLFTSVVVEFSPGGTVWSDATRADGEGTTDLSTSPTGSPHSFVWDSVPDLKGTSAKSVRIRIRLPGEDARPGATTAPFSLDNTLSDSDDDGLPDAWEETVAGADPDDELVSIADVTPDGDPDGDLSSNIREYLARTDPLDPQSNFSVSCAPSEGATVVIRWHSVAGRFYQLYKCEKMGGEWLALGNRQPGTGQVLSAVDETVTKSVGQRYYMVRVE